jgi:Ca2+-transporting ATPase
MWRNILVQSCYQLAVLNLFLFHGRVILGLRECDAADKVCNKPVELELNCFIFNVFMFLQIFSQINCRTIEKLQFWKGIHRSYYLITIVIITILVQVGLVEGVGGYAQIVGEKIGLTSLSMFQWGLSVGIGSGALVVGFIARCLPLCLFPGTTDSESIIAANEAKNAKSFVSVAVSEEMKPLTKRSSKVDHFDEREETANR